MGAVYCPSCGMPVAQAAPPSVPPAAAEARYATIGERFLAVLLDSIILFAVGAALALPFGFLAFMSGAFFAPMAWFFGPLQLLVFVLWILYFTYFEGTTGQTLGKRVMNIKVIDESSRQTVDMGRAAVRSVLRIVDWLPFLYILGLILVAVTGKRQRLGDVAARTIVVKA